MKLSLNLCSRGDYNKKKVKTEIIMDLFIAMRQSSNKSP